MLINHLTVAVHFNLMLVLQSPVTNTVNYFLHFGEYLQCDQEHVETTAKSMRTMHKHWKVTHMNEQNVTCFIALDGLRCHMHVFAPTHKSQISAKLPQQNALTL